MSSYTVSVRNRYEELVTGNENATEKYGKFIEANAETAEQLLPRKKRTKPSIILNDQRIVEARSKVQLAFANIQLLSSQENQQKLKECKNNLKSAYDVVMEEVFEKDIREVEAANNSRESWKLINRISGRKTTKQGIIKAKTKEERVRKWFHHFSTLLSDDPNDQQNDEEELEPVLQDMNIEEGDFTTSELQKAKGSLKDGKQSGPDNIPPEVIKRCSLYNILLDFANNLLKHNLKPRQWSEIDMLPVPKSGDLSDTGNYRGISLTSVVAKLVNKMILIRIQSKIDKFIRPTKMASDQEEQQLHMC